MNEILDEIENDKPKKSYYWGMILLHSIAVMAFMFFLMMYQSNISELLNAFFDANILVAGILVFVGLMINSIIMANRLSNVPSNFSDFKIAFAGGFSYLVGLGVFTVIMRIFYFFKGVSSADLIYLLIYSTVIFVFGFLLSLIRIKKVRKKKRRVEVLILVGVCLFVGYFMT